jgi:hypothetical protein
MSFEDARRELQYGLHLLGDCRIVGEERALLLMPGFFGDPGTAHGTEFAENLADIVSVVV